MSPNHGMVAHQVALDDAQLGHGAITLESNLAALSEEATAPAATSYTADSTWIERLFMNLLSYSIVLIPIAVIVIATKQKLFPRPLLSSALVHWFVYGRAEGGEDSKSRSETEDDSELLGREDGPKAPAKPNRQRPAAGSEGACNSLARSDILEFFFCLMGLQVSYLIWGLLQEKIMTTEYEVSTTAPAHKLTSDLGRHDQHRNASSTSKGLASTKVTFHDSQFLVFMNRLVAFVTAILAFVYTRHRKSRLHSQRYHSSAKLIYHDNPPSAQKPPAPLYKFIYSSLSNVLSSWCQYEALKYVNFPTQCLSKSCKVIPVMLMSKLLMNKRYPYIDYFCAALLALGMFVFMFNQPIEQLHHKRHLPRVHDQLQHHLQPGAKSIQSRNSKLAASSLMVSGLTILALYLVFDSFTSNWQQSLYARYDISNWQMMAASNFYSIFLTITSLHQLGNLRPAFDLLASSRVLMRDCLIMSLMSSAGQMFVYFTIKRFGSVIFAVIMTLRQFLSILLSCTIYKHSLNTGATLGLSVVFLVVGFQVWHKSTRGKVRPSQAKKDQSKREQSFGLAPIGRQLLSNGLINSREGAGKQVS